METQEQRDFRLRRLASVKMAEFIGHFNDLKKRKPRQWPLERRTRFNATVKFLQDLFNNGEYRKVTRYATLDQFENVYWEAAGSGAFLVDPPRVRFSKGNTSKPAKKRK